MLYESKYADLQVLIRSGSVNYHPATGVELSRVAGLVANFGTFGPEVVMQNPLTGQSERHSQAYGHFFDTEEAKERLGWNEDEHESVVASLDRLCREQPFLIAKVELTMPEITKPWPTYDETPWRAIGTLAQASGLTAEALAYERENKNRPAVIAALEDKPVPVEAVEEQEPSEDMITLGT